MNINNMCINFIEDMSSRAHVLRNIKQKYGLVPKRSEEFADFEKRVYETVFRKSNPKNNLLIQATRNLVDNTEEMQEILYKFLGFEEVPLDSFEKPDDNSMAGGFTIPDNDGSSIIVTKDKPAILKQAIIFNLQEDLESIILGREIDHNMMESGYAKAYQDAKFNSNNPVHRMYTKMYDSLLDAEEFVKLHEGIHAIHINNLNGHRKTSTENSYIKDAILMNLPVIGPLYKSTQFGNLIESEILAYKVGLDIYTNHLLSEVQNYARRMPRTANVIEQVKEEFKSLNTQFTKSIIRVGYLKVPMRGFSKPGITSLKAGAYGWFAYSNIDSESTILVGLAAMLGTYAVNNAIKTAAGLYFDNKISRNTNKVESLIAKYHGPKEFFQESLGKTIGQME